MYDSLTNTFSKYLYRGGSDLATASQVNLNDIQVSENDIFIPILWVFGNFVQYFEYYNSTIMFIIKESIF